MSDTKPVPCPVCGNGPYVKDSHPPWRSRAAVWCFGPTSDYGKVASHEITQHGEDLADAIARWNRAFSREGR